jgi:hypothetical protein
MISFSYNTFECLVQESEGTGWEGNCPRDMKQKERVVQLLLLLTDDQGKQGGQEG